jgi:acetyl esterase
MSPTIEPALNPKVEHHVREFLKALNSSGGKPLETLSPADARAVLVNAQASVPLELPRCDVEHKTIVLPPKKRTRNSRFSLVYC